MADNVGVDVEGEGDASSTTTNVDWSLQSSRRDSELSKVESVFRARENSMKNEIARLKNDRKVLEIEVAMWRKKYMEVEDRISKLESLAVELTQPCNCQRLGDTS